MQRKNIKESEHGTEVFQHVCHWNLKKRRDIKGGRKIFKEIISKTY